MKLQNMRPLQEWPILAQSVLCKSKKLMQHIISSSSVPSQQPQEVHCVHDSKRWAICTIHSVISISAWQNKKNELLDCRHPRGVFHPNPVWLSILWMAENNGQLQHCTVKSCHTKTGLEIFVIIIPKDSLVATNPTKASFWNETNYRIKVKLNKKKLIRIKYSAVFTDYILLGPWSCSRTMIEGLVHW